MDAILVVGGAGYVGSHFVDLCLRRGRRCVVLDDLSAGHARAVGDAPLVCGDFADSALLRRVFAKNKISAVLHFGGVINVGESAAAPAKYYETNVAKTARLLDSMREAGVRHFVFSSSAAVYGAPTKTPISEGAPTAPLSVYGRSKLFVEQMLADYAHAYGLRFVCLRYFNAAGASPDARIGEAHEPETHLIPLALRAAAGLLPALEIYGEDYPTPDGSCVRDYVHVCDLASAHLLALDALRAQDANEFYNLGNGRGYSVREVAELARAVSGRQFAVCPRPRRAGDVPELVADSCKARRLLGWKPQYESLETIIRHAWAWEQTRAKLAAAGELA